MFLRLPAIFLALLVAAGSLSAASFTYSIAPNALQNAYGSTAFKFGYLKVPEDHFNSSNGRTIQLATVIFKAKQATTLPPVIFLAGGPGGLATDNAAYFDVFASLQKKHDLVLIDQRGTGYSKPFLGITTASLKQAKLTFQATAVDVDTYNTTQNAADIADLRTALGYDKVIIFGNSYGTFLTQEVMRSHPDGIAAVVINGVLPATATFIPEFNHNTLHGLSELFRDVRANGPARRAFPNFSKTYFGLLTQLKKAPIKISSQLKITLDDFQSTIQGLLQTTQRIRIIPLLVTEIAAKRDSAWLRSYFSGSGESALDFSYGMYLSTLGTDWNQPNWLQLTKNTDKTLKPTIFRTTNAPSSLSVITDVRTWAVPYNPLATRTLLKSDIPTLLLTGKMEAQTPPGGAARVAKGLTHFYSLSFPRSGHGTGFETGPALSALVQFVDNPTRKPTYSLAALTKNNFYLTKVPAAKSRANERPLKFLP